MSRLSGFAINHVVAPRRTFAKLVELAQGLGLHQVEIRNDLDGVAIADGTPPELVRAEAEATGVRILALNALHPFDVWNAALAEKAKRLTAYAAASGVEALVLCPLNTTDDRRCDAQRSADLRVSLAELMPILREHGIRGLVEPLGFEESALRTKRAALDAIDAVGGASHYQLLHDTFHHHLAGEPEIFPDRTGLVHISGVTDRDLEIDRIRDRHRVLVDAADRLDTVGQMRALRDGGYEGPFSFEPFAPSVHALDDPLTALRESISFVAREADLTTREPAVRRKSPG